jgi:hypothetical protein
MNSSEIFDQGSDFFSTVRTTSATGTTSNKLVDSGASFTSADVGSFVWNSTDSTIATVTARDSGTVLSLSADIMASGETYYLHKSTFTAPVTGKYQLQVICRMDNVDDSARYYQMRIHTSNKNYYTIMDPNIGTDGEYQSQPTISILADMDANDVAYVAMNQSGGASQSDIDPETHFSGYLVC